MWITATYLTRRDVGSALQFLLLYKTAFVNLRKEVLIEGSVVDRFDIDNLALVVHHLHLEIHPHAGSSTKIAYISDAQSLAVGRDHQFIEPLHVMAALLDQEDGTARHLLGQAGIDVDALRARLDDALDTEDAEA